MITQKKAKKIAKEIFLDDYECGHLENDSQEFEHAMRDDGYTQEEAEMIWKEYCQLAWY